MSLNLPTVHVRKSGAGRCAAHVHDIGVLKKYKGHYCIHKTVEPDLIAGFLVTIGRHKVFVVGDKIYPVSASDTLKKFYVPEIDPIVIIHPQSVKDIKHAIQSWIARNMAE